MAGFRRRFRITPSAGRVTAAVEDDYHCMAVALEHDGSVITRVEAQMDRWPWSTCPGAVAVISRTFVGASLNEGPARGQKPANCTHLYDLALLAAAHAGETQSLTYDVLVSDPVGNRSWAGIARNDTTLFRWLLEDGVVREPDEIAGMSLFEMRGWISSLPSDLQEAARILQWASLIARGRLRPIEEQSDATRLPPNCYSFQPERAREATRIGQVLDFGTGPAEPLDHFNGAEFEKRQRATRVVWPQ